MNKCAICEARKYKTVGVAGLCEVPLDVGVQGGDAGQVQEGVWEHLARRLSQLLQGEDSAQGRILCKGSVIPMFISTEEMQDRFRKELENIWPGDFLNYFKEKILPKVGFYASEALTPCSSLLRRCRAGSGRSSRTSGQGTFSTTSRRRSCPR